MKFNSLVALLYQPYKIKAYIIYIIDYLGNIDLNCLFSTYLCLHKELSDTYLNFIDQYQLYYVKKETGLIQLLFCFVISRDCGFSLCILVLLAL